jgi:hypothetical protein
MTTTTKKVSKKEKPDSFSIKNEEKGFDICFYIAKEYSSKGYSSSFLKDDTVIEIKKGTKKIGSMEHAEDSVTIYGSELISFAKELKERTSKKLSKKVFSDSVFSREDYESFIKSMPYFEHNEELFKKYDDAFKKAGVSIVKNATSDTTIPLIFDKLTVYYESGSSSYQRKTISKSDFETWIKKNYSVGDDFFFSFSTFSPLSKYSVFEEIKIGGKIVGEYYRNNNGIMPFFRLFNSSTHTLFDTEPHQLILDFLAGLEKLKPEEQDEMKIIASSIFEVFTKSSKNNIMELENDIKHKSKTIGEYESNIKRLIFELHDLDEKLYFYKGIERGSPEQFYSVIEDALKLPFVKKLYLDSGKLHLSVKPFFLKIPAFNRSLGGSKNFGDRYSYIDDMTFILGETIGVVPSKNKRRIHPHVSNTPCFGSGAGRDKIYDALRNMNLSDLAKLLWFWANTYIPEAAYSSARDWYDMCLSEGIPVFESNGTRIIINDSARIKTGEQDTLTPTNNYASNIELYDGIEFKKK